MARRKRLSAEELRLTEPTVFPNRGEAEAARDVRGKPTDEVVTWHRADKTIEGHVVRREVHGSSYYLTEHGFIR